MPSPITFTSPSSDFDTEVDAYSDTPPPTTCASPSSDFDTKVDATSDMPPTTTCTSPSSDFDTKIDAAAINNVARILYKRIELMRVPEDFPSLYAFCNEFSGILRAFPQLSFLTKPVTELDSVYAHVSQETMVYLYSVLSKSSRSFSVPPQITHTNELLEFLQTIIPQPMLTQINNQSDYLPPARGYNEELSDYMDRMVQFITYRSRSTANANACLDSNVLLIWAGLATHFKQSMKSLQPMYSELANTITTLDEAARWFRTRDMLDLHYRDPALSGSNNRRKPVQRRSKNHSPKKASTDL